MNIYRLGAIVGVVALASSGWVFRFLDARSAPPAQRAVDVPASKESAAVSTVDGLSSAKAPARDARASIALKASAEAATVADARDLDRFLMTLEERARRQGTVSALEIEPGVQAIRRFDENGASRFSPRVLKFLEHMRNVSAELRAAKPNQQELDDSGAHSR